MSEGFLRIRGSEEPAVLSGPTTISGTNTDGALTGATLSTPPISFERAVTDPISTTAAIEAAFTLVTAGSMTGSIDQDRNVTLSARLRADLEIRVAALPAQVYRCAIQPVNLVLTGRHDEVSEAVELVDDSFSIPAAPTTSSCPEFIAGAVNDSLQGGGHAISLSMGGPLTAPVDPGEDTVTTLAVTPSGPVSFGDAVTLTATVAAADGDGPVPGGFVELSDGVTVLATVPLDEAGSAELVTTAISAGTRQITARYTGTPPVYAASSATRTLVVMAHPMVTVDLPPSVEVGGDPVDLDVVATNTGLGRALPRARIDVVIQRSVGTGPIAPVGETPRLVLSTVNEEGPATPIALTATGSGSSARLSGVIGAAVGAALPAGGSWAESLRLQVASTMGVGPLRFTFTLVEVDGEGAVVGPLATGSDDIEVVGADRIDTTIVAGHPGVPPILPAIAPISPARVRAGNVVDVKQLRVIPHFSGVRPTGNLRFSIEGRPLLARERQATTWSTSVPVDEGQPVLALPSDLTGSKLVTVSYQGDARFRPAAADFPVTIEPAIGPAYECIAGGTVSGAFRANLEASAALPAAAASGEVPLASPRVRLNFARDTLSLSLFFEMLLPDANAEISVTLGEVGSARAEMIQESNATAMDAAGTPPIDHVVALRGVEGQLDVAGAPGQVLDVPVSEVRFSYTESFVGGLITVTCTPVDGPLSLGSVTVAGTVLSAEPGGRVREGSPVTLRSTSAPAGSGTVEFLDGDRSIGVVPTVDGAASMATDALAVGTHRVTAVFRSSLGIPTTTSEPVEVVVEATACEQFADEGHGAVVRLVYLSLLGRCPDRAGFDHWTGRLDAGTSPVVFARTVAATTEAVGRVVDDAYRTMLERRADAAGRAFWVDRLSAHGRYDRLLADLGASEEFWTRAGSSNDGFVIRVYERMLRRAPDQPGQDHWVGRLDAGVSRGELIVHLANLDEPLAVLVADAHDEILGRRPTSGERAEGMAQLRATGDRSALYARLIGTPEFFVRAQSLPNPGD